MAVNRVIYAIALIGAFCTFIATNSAAALTLTVAVALAPFAGISASLAASKKTRVAFETQPSCTVGQEQTLEISLQRPMPLRGRMELSLSCRNLLLDTTENVTVSLAPSIAHHEKYLFPLETDTCGHIVISLVSMRVIDIMGFTKIRVRQESLNTSYTVYPQINDLSIHSERASFTTFSGSSYDRKKRVKTALKYSRCAISTTAIRSNRCTGSSPRASTTCWYASLPVPPSTMWCCCATRMPTIFPTKARPTC